MDYECNFCKKIFSNKGNLKNHQDKAKYCLALREEHNINFKCEYCNKNLASRYRLEDHYETCKKKMMLNFENKIQEQKIFYENLLKQKDESILNLQNQIKELASLAIQTPSNIINNTSNNNSHNKMIDNRVLNMIPLDLNQENLKKTLEEKFTENHLINGQKGVAQFFVDHYLISEDQKYMFKCTDPSRKMFIYLDDEGKIHKDINALRFTKNISDPVIEVTHNMLNELPDKYPDDNERMDYATVKFMEIANIKNDNNEFIKNLIPPLISKS